MYDYVYLRRKLINKCEVIQYSLLVQNFFCVINRGGLISCDSLKGSIRVHLLITVHPCNLQSVSII